MKPPNAQYLAARRGVFARGITRNFASDAAPLFRAVEHARKEIQAAGALDDIPPFTDIAVKYGALLTRSLLLSFVKGSDNARKRKYRKNSLSLDDILDFSWDLPNTAAVAAFYREAFEMAAVHTQDLRDALFADAKEVFAQGGTYRDWADNFSLHGFEPANPYHLRTNYDTAANAAYSAGNWQQIVAAAGTFPYLRYVTVRDDKVREEHAALDGLEFPVDHPFWLTYMPPNGWNCRCGVEQLSPSEYHGNEQPRLADIPLQIPPEFQNNPGITNQFLYQSMLQKKVDDLPSIPLDEAWRYPKDDPPALFVTDHLSLNDLIDLGAKYLGDRWIYDPNHVPLALMADKSEKFKTYGLEEVRKRFKYLRCIDDTIKHPNEVWLNPANKRLYYLKQYKGKMFVIAEIEADNQIRFFDIVKKDGGGINSLRKGLLVYRQ